jgi:hypothetical protein
MLVPIEFPKKAIAMRRYGASRKLFHNSDGLNQTETRLIHTKAELITLRNSGSTYSRRYFFVNAENPQRIPDNIIRIGPHELFIGILLFIGWVCASLIEGT